jgi:hypothetical protein
MTIADIDPQPASELPLPTMRGADIVDTLGVMSSHPATSLWRMCLWAAVALLPIACGVVVLILWAYDDASDPFRFLVNHGRAIAVYGLVTAGFAMGFGLTALATAVAARSRMLVADGDAGISLTVCGVILLLLTAGLAVWTLPFAFNLPTTIRTLLAWLGLLPIVLLLSLATLLPYEDSIGQLLKRPFKVWTLLLPAVVVAGVIATRYEAASRWLSELGFVRAPLQVLLDSGVAAGMPPEAADSMQSWIVTCLVAIAASPLLGMAVAATTVVSNYFAVRGRRLQGAANTPPAWLHDIRATMPFEHGEGSWIPSLVPAGESVDWALPGHPALDFFAESAVTTDQVEALRAIMGSTQSWSETTPSDVSRMLSADHLLEGPVGSGRTSTLVAAILQGVLINGETILVFVPHANARTSLAVRLRLAAKAVFTEGFVDVSELTADESASWIHPLRTEAPGPTVANPPPRVLVGTLDDFERRFLAPAYDYDRLAAVLADVATVAIDDLESFTVQDRIHLPYTLAKIRLLTASHNQSVRTLVTCAPLAEAARDLVVKQLLTMGTQGDQTLRLGAVPPPVNCRLWLTPVILSPSSTVSVHDMLAACGRACIARGLSVAAVVFDATQAEVLEIDEACRDGKRLREEQVLSVVSDVGRLPTLGMPQHSAVAAAARIAVMQSHVGVVVAWEPSVGSTVAFFTPGQPTVPDDPPAQHALMVLPGKESEALFARHFASIARFMPRLHPSPRRLWTALGLPRPGQLLTRLASKRPPEDLELIDRRILLDPPDPIAAFAASDPLRWAWCAVSDSVHRAGPPSPRPVDVRGSLSMPAGMVAAESGAEAVVTERHQTLMPGQRSMELRDITWLGPDGSELARDDLASMHTFRLDTGAGVFTPQSLHQPPAGPMVVDARPWSPRQRRSLAYMPAYTLSHLAFPAGIWAKCILQSSPLSHRVSVYGLVSHHRGDDPPAVPPWRTQMADFKLDGLYDESGRLRRWQAQVRYEASKFFLLFDAPENYRTDTQITERLMVDWGEQRLDTHRIIPELGAAITCAMKRQAPGLERLVRCLGVEVAYPGEAACTALVFIEPRSTESSGFAIMEPIMYEMAVFAELFGFAADVLERCAQDDDPAAALFSRAGYVVNPRCEHGRLTADQGVMKHYAAWLHSLASDAASIA